MAENKSDITSEIVKAQLYEMLCNTSTDGRVRVECARLLLAALVGNGPDGPRPGPGGPVLTTQAILGPLLQGLAGAFGGAIFGCKVSLDLPDGQSVVLEGNLTSVGGTQSAVTQALKSLEGGS